MSAAEKHADPRATVRCESCEGAGIIRGERCKGCDGAGFIYKGLLSGWYESQTGCMELRKP